ncbi:hypothetical protein C8R44DRAFT_932433 [Mycena epipterygia]|nr:hypothetical protein C8R44DRAFT_932433 [Mycena epipterygia]
MPETETELEKSDKFLRYGYNTACIAFISSTRGYCPSAFEGTRGTSSRRNKVPGRQNQLAPNVVSNADGGAATSQACCASRAHASPVRASSPRALFNICRVRALHATSSASELCIRSVRPLCMLACAFWRGVHLELAARQDGKTHIEQKGKISSNPIKVQAQRISDSRQHDAPKCALRGRGATAQSKRKHGIGARISGLSRLQVTHSVG